MNEEKFEEAIRKTYEVIKLVGEIEGTYPPSSGCSRDLAFEQSELMEVASALQGIKTQIATWDWYTKPIEMEADDELDVPQG